MAGRPKKKPEYNPELQFNNFLQELRDAYEEADSLRSLADELNISLLKLRKLLITADVFTSDICTEINDLHQSGKKIPEIMKLTGLSRASVHSYLPYTKGLYNAAEMKGTLKRVMSGVLSVITIASAVAQPITAYAAEPEKAASSFEAQYLELETVKDKLAEDEILIANDYSIDYGSDFDIKVDFSGIEGINDAKVKVELYEAKNEAGDDFDTYQADTYKAVYKVEPVSGNPSYRISRNVTVKEPETEQLTEPNTSENTVGEGNAGETEDSGNAEEDADAEGQTEIVTDLAEEEEVTTDEESGLTVSEVMDQAEDSGIDLYSMEEGEVVTFMAKDVVKSQFLKLNSEHIRFVLKCLKENTSKVINIRQYLLTVLYNAPLTISNYYSALVQHDMYGDSEK